MDTREDTRVALGSEPATADPRGEALEVLLQAGIPFVVGGAYASAAWTGVHRDTRDLDLFLIEPEASRALRALETAGWDTELPPEDWLYKAHRGDTRLDLIFSSHNRLTAPDGSWFEHAREGEVFGRRCRVLAPEELLWSKAFVQARDRYDGAEIQHLLRCTGRLLDWERVVRRFDATWEVLLAHLLLFWFAFPSERDAVPANVMDLLLARAEQTRLEGPIAERLCRGPMLAPFGYEHAIEDWGYRDARLLVPVVRPH